MIHNNTHLSSNRSGFTAVELLITLFVAAIFLSAGYILYNVVVTRSAEARHQIEADAIATDYLQRKRSTVPVSCIPSPPVTTSLSAAESGSLAAAQVTISVICPVPAESALSKVVVKVEYKENGTTESVQHEAYASR